MVAVQFPVGTRQTEFNSRKSEINELPEWNHILDSQKPNNHRVDSAFGERREKVCYEISQTVSKKQTLSLDRMQNEQHIFFSP